MRIHPDRQTLILAGEVSPRRSAAASNASAQRVTVISARVDAVVTQTDYGASGVADDPIADADFNDVSSPALSARTGKASTAVTSQTNSANAASVYSASAYTASAYVSASRSTPFGGASAYARTQDLSERHPIIDTYA